MTTEKNEKPEPKKISKESAKAQIESWLNFYGLDFEDIELENGEDAAKTITYTLVRAIQRGELEINIDGTAVVTQHLVMPIGSTTKIEYKGNRIGYSRVAMEKYNDTETRTYGFLAAMSGVEFDDLMKLDGADLTVMKRISVVFGMV